MTTEGDSHGNKFHIVIYDSNGKFKSEFECSSAKVSRCCGLKITQEGYVVTLAKNNHHVLVLEPLFANGHTTSNRSSNAIQNKNYNQSVNDKQQQLLQMLSSSSLQQSLMNNSSSNPNNANFLKDDLDLNDSVTQLNLYSLLALYDQTNTLNSNQSTKNLTNLNNNLSDGNNLINSNQNADDSNSSFIKHNSSTAAINNNHIQSSTLDTSLLQQHLQDLSFNDSLLNNINNNLSKSNADQNDSVATSELNSIIGSSITSPIPPESLSMANSSSGMAHNNSILQQQHHQNGSKKKSMTIKCKFGHLGMISLLISRIVY